MIKAKSSTAYDDLIVGCGNGKGRVKYKGRFGWIVFGLPMTYSFGVVFDDNKRETEVIKAADLTQMVAS